MVQHTWCARHYFATANPAVLGQAEIDRNVHVIDCARWRDSLGWHFNNEVGFAECPLRIGPGERRERIAVAFDDRAVVNPMNEHLHLVVTEIHFVLNLVTHFVINLARWHAFSHYHFADHRRPTLHCQTIVHCERRDSALAVTFGAVFGNDRCDVISIGQVGVSGRIAVINSLAHCGAAN